jgi:hypothetical protein
MSDGHAEFDRLSKEVHAARNEAHGLHGQWNDACLKLHRLERELSDVFRRIARGPADHVGSPKP